VREVRVHWPDAARTGTSYTDLALDHTYRIVQGAAPVQLERPPVPFRKMVLGDATAEHHHQ
jgi:hypothetical protein